MSLSTDDKVVLLPGKGQTGAIQARSANTVGNTCLLLYDNAGQPITFKTGTPAVGDRVILIPDKDGKSIAVKIEGIIPNPPASWALVQNLGTDSVIVFKEFSSTLYAGCYNAASGGYCLKSTDGSTWEVSFDWTSINMGWIYALESFGTNIYCGGQGWGINTNTIFRSSDGSTWNAVYDSGNINIYIGALEEHGGNLYAVLIDLVTGNTQILKSANGTVWGSIYTSPANTYFQTLASHGASLYASVSDAHGVAELWISNDDGVNWVDTTTVFGAETYLFATESMESKLYSGSYPNGKIYQEGVEVQNTGATNGVYSFCNLGGLFFAGLGDDPASHGMVYYSEDNGATWALSYDIPTVSVVRAVCPFNKRIYAGTINGGKIYRSAEIK